LKAIQVIYPQISNRNLTHSVVSFRKLVILKEWMIPRLYIPYYPRLTYQLRFLRARKFDVEKAYIMFTDCEKWREEFGVDEIVKTFKFDENPLVTSYYPRYYHKTDKVIS
jgi:hypothetical protein